MPSAANGKSEKPASSEATDNSPVRQIMTIIDHKIRNLEKRKSKLTSYRDLQKSGKDLNADQKVAVAKYDEVNQTLEFARDLSKQMASIALSAEREAKKQAKKEAWVRYAADTGKIREVLLVLDCLMQMGNSEAREDFLNGANGAAKLTEADLKILDDLYPEVTPKHEVNEEGQASFFVQTTKAAEHLYGIIDGKPKEVFGTTYAHIKQIITSVHECGYFDKTGESAEAEQEGVVDGGEPCVAPDDLRPSPALEPSLDTAHYVPAPAPPAPSVVPAPAYPLCPLPPLPPITLQEVEHAYFAQQYPQQRPISEVIGSQNFFFLQESEIDSPAGTPQPPAGVQLAVQGSPPGPIPSQTFTNQHFVQIAGARLPPDAAQLPLPQAHFAPHPDHPTFPVPPHAPLVAQPAPLVAQPAPLVAQPAPAPASAPPAQDAVDEWKESGSPDRDDDDRNKTQGQGDGQNRFRRYGGRGGGGGRPANGYRGRGGGFQSRQSGDGYHGRHGDYQGRPNKEGGYERRQYNDNYQSRHKDGYSSNRGGDNYYGNGDSANGHQNESNGPRYGDNGQSYGGGFKGRGRGGSRGARGTSGTSGAGAGGNSGGTGSRPPRSHFARNKQDNVE